MILVLSFMAWMAMLAGPPMVAGAEAPKAPAPRLHFRAAQAVSAPGYVEMTRLPESAVFVAGEDFFGAAEILGAGENGVDALGLTVSADVVARLRAERPDLIAVLFDDRLAAVGLLEFGDGKPWNVRLSGLARVEVSRLSWMLSEEANSRLPVSMVVVPPGDVQNAGSVFDVVVYLVGVESVGSYQFVLETSAPQKGWLRREGLAVDAEREDFIYRGRSPRITTDNLKGEIGAVVEDSAGVTREKSYYLGRVRFRASEDAVGTFAVHVKRSPETFVRDSAGAAVLFNHGSAVFRLREPVTPRLQK